MFRKVEAAASRWEMDFTCARDVKTNRVDDSYSDLEIQSWPLDASIIQMHIHQSSDGLATGVQEVTRFFDNAAHPILLGL